MTDPFAREIISYLLKILLTGIGAISACAVAFQLYFRRAIPHEAKKALLKKKVHDEALSGSAELLARFERDIASLKAKIEAFERKVDDARDGEAELRREMRWTNSEVKGLRTQIQEMQPQFIGMMAKFIKSLESRKTTSKEIPKSGGRVRISDEDPSGETP